MAQPASAKYHSEPSALWGKAYDSLKSQHPELVEKYEEILSAHLPGQTNTSKNVVSTDPKERQAQMESIMKNGMERVDARRIRYRIAGKEFDLENQVSEATDLLLSVRDWIAGAVKSSPEASLAWAGVSLVLVFLNNRSTALSAQNEGFTYVTSRLRYYIALESIMLPESGASGIDGNLRDRYEDVVLDLYIHVLKFQIHSVRRFYRGRLGNLGRDLINADEWKSMLDKIKELEEEIEKKSAHINSSIAREKLSGLKANSTSTLQLLERQVELAEEWSDLFQQKVDAILDALAKQSDLYKQTLSDEERKKLDSLLEKLFVSDYEMFKHRIDGRVEGTCQWFLEHQNYKQWLSQDSGPLFVSADPGCGKSVLAKYLVDEALPRDATICYFFFKDPYATTAKQAVCSTVHQLLKQKPHLAHHALDHFRGVGEHLPEALSVVWNMLVDTVTDPEAGHIIWVVDALDECAELELRDLISLIEGFFDSSKSKRTKFRILLTSRPYYSVTTKVEYALAESFPNIRIPGEDESDAIMEEVDRVIRYRIERLSNLYALKKSLRDHLEARIFQIEHRTYLWVHLVFDYLEKSKFQKTMRGISDRIDTVPAKVDGVYEQILLRVEEENRETVQKALSIILAADRPLTLQEMNVALNVASDMSGEDELDLEDDDDFKNTLRDWCSLFVTVYNGRVTLIHQTAREFLLAKFDQGRPTEALETSTKSWQHSIPLSRAHAILSISCVAYLNYMRLRGLQFDEPEIESIIKEHPFLGYACWHWSSHIRDCGYVSDEIRHLYISICSPDQSLCKFWLELGRELRRLYSWKGDDKMFRIRDLSVEDLLPQTLPAYFGHLEGLKMLEGSEKSQTSREALSPFFAACWGGHSQVAQYLLERGDNTDTTFRDQHVLSLALGRDASGKPWTGVFLEIFSRIIEDVPPRRLHALQGYEHWGFDDNMYPSLHYAAAYLDLIYLEILLRKRGIEIDVRDSLGRTALHCARGAEKVLCLLQHGASVSAEDYLCQTPLFCSQGAEGKKLLIEWGADIHATDVHGRTALHEAKDADDVSVLVESGVPVDALDHNGLTPLLYKTTPTVVTDAQSGPITALLELGANPNAKDRDGISPLAAIVRVGSSGLDKASTIMSTLLRYGADPNIPDNHGLNPLCFASGGFWRSRMKSIVETLLNNGANVNSKDELGRTPLHYACWNARTKLVKYLLRRGADVQITDLEGNSPLHLCTLPAILQDWEIMYTASVVELLNRAGAKFDAVNHRGMTPLLAAAANERYLHWIAALAEATKSDTLVADDRGMTVLHHLAANVQLGKRIDAERRDGTELLETVLNRLWETGAEAVLEARDKEGRTPLLVAASHANDAVLRALLDRGASVEAKDEMGNTVLHCLSLGDPVGVYEADKCFYRVSTAWQSTRQSFDVRNNKGRTPLHEACDRGKAFLSEALAWSGADPGALDNTDCDPLQLVPEVWRDDMRGFVERGCASRGQQRPQPFHEDNYAPIRWPPALPRSVASSAG
ncbi:hypothetical protein Z517_09505 [Fonsecaea pedrosoi CBS 271.37]|uniref:NWD NACHT-NTPase N-terminal domain-containing protein n=1 Tax=Fonsecaea pedrosoi CBS 271.37 TaxID=1442368 RepID=A0A0D2GXJ4_9EURO|nr:uncharacterized protein Z517_09505 [Fonsecaea pedrosoi CBS 271.37]KIW77059.1 hypothetical protein Z517_09505 [Fonsecaea pedrosoi CBS 271.37]